MRETLLCSPQFGEEEYKTGEFTETGPINNDPEVEASLFSVNEDKNMLMFGMEDMFLLLSLSSGHN